LSEGPASELLRAENLTRRFKDGFWGLKDVNLSLREGDFLVLAGRNGSGKSLLARHLLALSTPSSGRVLYRERPVTEDPRLVRSMVALVFQDTEAQILGRTVEEDVAFGPENLGLSREEVALRTERALEVTGLRELRTRRPDVLSGGERRRLAIAGALAMEGEALILDEPFANLDYPAIRRVLRLIVDLHHSGKTIVLTTHELEKVLAHATRLAVMDGGALVYQGSPHDFPRDRYESLGLANPFRGYSRVEDLSWLN